MHGGINETNDREDDSRVDVETAGSVVQSIDR